MDLLRSLGGSSTPKMKRTIPVEAARLSGVQADMWVMPVRFREPEEIGHTGRREAGTVEQLDAHCDFPQPSVDGVR